MNISWMDLHKTSDNGFQPVANITIRPSGFLPVPCIAHLSIYCFLVSFFLICKKLTSWCKLSYTIMNFYEIHTNHIKSIHIINKKQICPVGLISVQANSRRATDHQATVRSGYCQIGLLSSRVLSIELLSLRLMSNRAVQSSLLRSATLLLGYCLPALFPRVSVLSGYYLHHMVCIGMCVCVHL